MRAMRDTFISIGMPPTEATIASDLADHAAEQAAEAMVRVVDTAPQELKSIVMMAACRILIDNLNLFMHEHMKEPGQ